MALLNLLSVALLGVSVEAFAPIALPSSTRPSTPSASSLSETSNNNDGMSTSFSRRSAIYSLAGLTISPLFLPTLPASARLEGVNKPELLPSEPGLNVIQVEKFLTKGQEKRLNDMLTSLEADTGFRVRVLCQAYPSTPGLAIRDYWDLAKEGAKDDKFVVLVSLEDEG
ncbi:hypothetical protein ACHAXR_005671, partial [Thalassiosira sp. AJA248-18]